MSGVSPLAPSSFPELPPVAGVRLGAMEAGIKYKGRHDLALWLLDEGTTVAGTFTNRLPPAHRFYGASNR